MADDRAVVHFMVPVSPGKGGLPSSPPKNAAALPPILQKALTGVGRKYVFACDDKLVPEFPSPHVGTGEPALVNCLRCRATQAWKDAPESGPYLKDPAATAKAEADAKKELDKYLAPEIGGQG